MKHTLHTRRQFLRTSLLGGAVSWTIPAFLERTFFTLDAMAADSAIQTASGKDGPILIVLQLAGGNDGLNTLVPFGDDAYFRARPTIAIPGEKTLRLNDHFGLNPKLVGLKALHDEGHLEIVQGAGYPNPNRSHFRSTEIWHTASDSSVNEKYGWGATSTLAARAKIHPLESVSELRLHRLLLLQSRVESRSHDPSNSASISKAHPIAMRPMSFFAR